ncbi:hypothetical protein SCUCBS95973_005615 [Sporothrix curviconia]|uniref:Pre-mRNA-splicing factor 38B n=1 Tax=Sporothrix curviconia TaxID=1260050 RepID=A0ABP0BYP8_9PEZI
MDDDLDMQAYKLLIEPAPAPLTRTSRPPSKMKPNTRFLSHIVREANSHNAALLARETADARKRLKRLMREDGNGAHDDDRRSSAGGDDRKRKDESRHRGRHASRAEDAKYDEDRHRRRRSHADGHDDDTGDDERNPGSRSRHSHRQHRSRHRDSSREDRAGERERKDRDRRSRHSHRRDRSREDDTNDKNDKNERNNKDHRTSKSKQWRRSASPRPSSSKHHRRDRGRSRDDDGDGKRTRYRSLDDSSREASLSASGSASSSDPLDEFVGPRLASDPLAESGGSDSTGMRIRGRGAHSATGSGFSSSMDRHFAADYDPAKDVEHPLQGPRPQVAPRTFGPSTITVDDEDTEMQDDRKQLLRGSAERLRKAGFTDKEIAILARGGRRHPGHTPWAKKGEAREWDRDKVEGDDGPAKPVWAR